jgi:phosphoserine phosphatase RsbU/P
VRLKQITGSRGLGILLAGALVGIAVFAFLLPRIHPEAAADLSVGQETVSSRSERFLEGAGYEPGMATTVEERRSPDLIGHMRSTMGGRPSVAYLRGPEGGDLPAHFWRVVHRNGEDGAERQTSGAITVVSVRDGGVLSMMRADNAPRPYVMRDLLGQAGVADRMLSQSDSLLNATLRFDRSLAGWGGAAVEVAGEESDGGALGPHEARVLAEYHMLRSVAGRQLTMRPDSIWIADTEGRRAAVRFRTAERQAGLEPIVQVDVAPGGGLLRLSVAYHDAAGTMVEGFGGVRQAGASTPPYDVVTSVLYFILGVILLVAFIRRLHLRLVDANMALRDALWGAFFLFLLTFSTIGAQVLEGSSSFWGGVAIAAVGMTAAVLGGGLLVFVVSCAADSLARDVWPRRLQSLTHVRLFHARNVVVGRSLFLGLMVAGVLLGVHALMLTLIPAGGIDFGTDGRQMSSHSVLNIAGVGVGRFGWKALLVSLLVVGVGALLARRWSRTSVIVPVMALLFLAVQPLPETMAPLAGHLLIAGAVALILSLTFWYGDVLAVITALWSYGMIWFASVAMLPTGAGSIIVPMLVLAVVVGIGILAWVGLRSKSHDHEAEAYQPVYLVEMAQRERLQREFEIARQVQVSFLPQRMPAIEGAEIAAFCHAAQEVGGDYFDFVEIGPRKLAVLVGDVSGKGISAAFYMTLMKGFVRALCRMGLSPKEVLVRLNELFIENVPRGIFISMVYGVLDLDELRFTFARAGHNPIIYSEVSRRRATMIRPRGIALGLAKGAAFERAIAEEIIDLSVGDALVIYTDGITEAMNADRSQYGDERLIGRVAAALGGDAGILIESIADDVNAFTQGAEQHDDMTCVAIRLSGSVQVPAEVSRMLVSS